MQPSEPLDRFLEELRRWGERTNLVGSLAPDALRVHVDDSLAAAPHLPEGARVVDLGSGAGFPGVPLAIARPDLEIALVEIRERRVNFLRHVVRTLDLSCEVLRVRIEDPTERRYDFALLRAVAPPAEVIPPARYWLHERGQVWIWSTELASALPPTPHAPVPLGSRGAIHRLTAS